MRGWSFEKTVRILEELDATGYSLYALTNWSTETLHLAIERYCFLSLWKEIVISGIVGLIKSDPRIYELLVECTGIDTSYSAFVDDRVENVRAAERVGFTGVTFHESLQLRDRLSTLGLLTWSSD